MKKYVYPLVAFLIMMLSGCVAQPVDISDRDPNPPADNAKLRILAIGNSFTINATTYFPKLLDEVCRDDEVYVCKVTLGGSSLKNHWDNYKDKAELYDLSWTTGKKWYSEGKTSIDKALALADWDIIVIQQVSGLSGCPETFNPYLPNITSELRKQCKGVQIAWQMTWAYSRDSDHSQFYRYDKDSAKMYDAIVRALKIVKPYVDTIIPSGYLINELRSSEYNDESDLTLDGFHLELGIPRYSLTCLWYERLIYPRLLISCKENNYRPKADTTLPVTDDSAVLIFKLIDESLLFSDSL